jgi:hypothetical protein
MLATSAHRGVPLGSAVIVESFEKSSFLNASIIRSLALLKADIASACSPSREPLMKAFPASLK